MKRLIFSITFAMTIAIGIALIVCSPSGATQGGSVSPIGLESPDALISYTVSPGSAPVGAAIDFTVVFDSIVDTTSYAICFYFKAADEPAWVTNFPSNQTDSAAGVIYSKDATAGSCPTAGSYQNFYYYTSANSGNGALGDTVRFRVVIPNIVAENKITGVRLFSGTTCKDTDGPGGATGPGGTLCNGDALAKTASFSVQNAPPVIYASDQPTCGGYGAPGASCFQSLDSAIYYADVYGSTTVVIVGDLTLDVDGSSLSVTNEPRVLQGTNNGRLIAANGCTGVLSINQGAEVRDLTIDGTYCPSATGLSVTDSPIINDVIVKNFNGIGGAGIAILGSSSTLLSLSNLLNNDTGVIESSSGSVWIGGTPVNGNTLTGNNTGIVSDGGAYIKGNNISGGMTGVRLMNNATAFYGNRITGAIGLQVDCDASANSGAAFNYLGGISPTTGSDCSDVNSQLGANYINWVDGSTSLLQITNAPTNSVIFDLGNNPPFNVGVNGPTGLGQLLSNFYAIKAGGSGPLTVDFNGAGAGRLYEITDPSDCIMGASGTCWDFVEVGVDIVTYNNLKNTHYVVGQTNDPTSIKITSLRAVSKAQFTWLPLFVLTLLLGLIGSTIYIVRKEVHP